MNYELCSVPEAAKRLGLSEVAAYRMVREGRFPVPVLRIGRKVQVFVEPIEKLLAEAYKGSAQPFTTGLVTK